MEEKMGSKYVKGRSIDLSEVYKESGPSTPLFFILSPGVDPLKDVEALGTRLGFTIDNGKIHNVSLGQGQEIVAEHAMEVAAAEGHWVILQVGEGSGAHHRVHSSDGNRPHQGTKSASVQDTVHGHRAGDGSATTWASCSAQPKCLCAVLHLPLWSHSSNQGVGRKK